MLRLLLTVFDYRLPTTREKQARLQGIAQVASKFITPYETLSRLVAVCCKSTDKDIIAANANVDTLTLHDRESARALPPCGSDRHV